MQAHNRIGEILSTIGEPSNIDRFIVKSPKLESARRDLEIAFAKILEIQEKLFQIS